VIAAPLLVIIPHRNPGGGGGTGRGGPKLEIGPIVKLCIADGADFGWWPPGLSRTAAPAFDWVLRSLKGHRAK